MNFYFYTKKNTIIQVLNKYIDVDFGMMNSK